MICWVRKLLQEIHWPVLKNLFAIWEMSGDIYKLVPVVALFPLLVSGTVLFCWLIKVPSLKKSIVKQRMFSLSGTTVIVMQKTAEHAWAHCPSSIGHLATVSVEDLEVSRCNLARYGQRSFNVSGPWLWNSLPLTVRDSSLTLTSTVLYEAKDISVYSSLRNISI